MKKLLLCILLILPIISYSFATLDTNNIEDKKNVANKGINYLDSITQAQLLAELLENKSDYRYKISMITSIIFTICFLFFLLGLIFLILYFRCKRKYDELLRKNQSP